MGGGTGSAARSRHFLRRYYTFLQRVKLGEVTLKHVPDVENPTDFFTKWCQADKVERSIAYLTGKRRAGA